MSEICSKITIKDTRTMSLIAFIVKFEQMSLAIPGSRNSIIDFKNTLALDEFKSKQKSV